MNKFEQLLGQPIDEMAKRRAKRMSEGAYDGYETELRNRNKAIRQLEAERDAMMDISASPDRNLDNGAKDFDGDSFIKQLCDIEVKISVQQAELAIIRQKVGPLFDSNEGS